MEQAKKTGMVAKGKWRYADWIAGKYDRIFDDFKSDAEIYLKHLLATGDTQFLYKKGQYSGEDVASIIADETISEPFNLFILDHFHALKGNDSFENQSKAMTAISAAAESIFRPVLILGQFRKKNISDKSPLPDMDEFSGSSQIIYIPQNIAVMAPKYNEHSTDKWETYFHVVKSRTASDAKGFIGVHSFDMESKKYSQQYQMFRNMPHGDPTEVPGNQIPSWAVNGVAVPISNAAKKPINRAFGKNRFGEKED